MTLAESITAALALTDELAGALAGDRPERSDELLAARGRAMADFEAAHRAAEPADRAAAEAALAALAAADRGLQEAARTALGDAETLLRTSRGTSSQRSRAYDNGTQACVDRRA